MAETDTAGWARHARARSPRTRRGAQNLRFQQKQPKITPAADHLINQKSRPTLSCFKTMHGHQYSLASMTVSKHPVKTALRGA